MKPTDLTTDLESGLAALDLAVGPPQVQLLLRYLDELNRWNQTYNLTAVRSREAMLGRHVLDALSIHPYLAGSRWIDVGAGAGLPGIPLAVVQPERQFWLLDSAGKKARFMRHAARTLRLPNVTVLEMRVEQHQPSTPYDGVLARAFAPMDRLLALTGHLLRSGGQVLAMQGPNQAKEAVIEGFRLRETVTLSVPGSEGVRKLSIVEKTPEAAAWPE
ncbi:MAG: 16S rRNA (guanine(527)-N(7))-methyltransferase RsmG [Pseudomonadota bacterium]